MRLSTKSRFAVTALIDVSLRESRGPVSLAAISERHQISLSYLEQLFSKLRAAKLVESTRGPGGGYTLGRRAETISMADIVSAVDAPQPTEAGEQAPWMSSELWTGLNQQMVSHLQAVSLRQLVAEQRASGAVTEPPAPAKVASPKRGVFAVPKSRTVKVNAPNSVFALAGAWGTGNA